MQILVRIQIHNTSAKFGGTQIVYKSLCVLSMYFSNMLLVIIVRSHLIF